ncbi:MAG TPA: ABC transporter substrate-binding protein [Acetobacteraceae bacterium]
MLTRRTTLLAALLIPAAAQAADTDQATAMVQKLLTELTAVVNGPGNAASKQAALRQLVDQNVDVEGVARFCLGRFWRTATPPQQQAYVQEFRSFLMGNITGKVGDYHGVTFSMGRAQAREDGVAVSTIVNRPGNAPNNVDWVVSTAGGSPKIIDVIAEGTSLRLTQRSDYAAFLGRNNNNVQALIDAMRQQQPRAG